MRLFRDDETINLHVNGTYVDMVKNYNWKEANQLAIIQVWPRIWTRDYQVQIQLVVRAGLELAATELQDSVVL